MEEDSVGCFYSIMGLESNVEPCPVQCVGGSAQVSVRLDSVLKLALLLELQNILSRFIRKDLGINSVTSPWKKARSVTSSAVQLGDINQSEVNPPDGISIVIGIGQLIVRGYPFRKVMESHPSHGEIYVNEGVGQHSTRREKELYVSAVLVPCKYPNRLFCP
ncbi:hypothetical protein J6590_104382 [Homalodisca vitripennis]|nr:hypothetical protein J6590_104382 [Homalodisca vitripennis]